MTRKKNPIFTKGQISHAWLSNILSESVTIRQIQPLAAGYVSDVYRIHLQATDLANKTTSVIVKTASLEPAKRMIASQFKSYQREYQFYRDIAPELDLSTPECYYKHFHEQPLSFCLVLEDVSSADRYPDTRASAQTIDETIVKQMAGLHQSHWNLPSGLPTFIDNLDQIGASYRAVFDRHKSIAHGCLGDFAWEVVRDYIHHGFKVQQPYPSTLIHVDIKPDNFSLKNDLTLFDWGDYCFGPPTFDLANFMINTPNSHQACQRHDLHLMAIYHKTLLELGVLNYSLREFHQDFQDILPLLAFTPLALINAAPGTSKTDKLRRILQQLGQMIEWHC
ncbi:MAG: phosphotransferase [Gammaproteobacteria bacterium]|jgi:hypothetical protein|nr:phosphotransferase [Gammaproteobacteria bacterium]MBT5203631.1 phosphotransferase [Gammaproteobacteria bacterium]MBT5602488.1 phosphotransferase [Gammaproteobacteria bacterium]MBT6247168.1 phosphotransferase [Gammaproteobacteria bacterium]